MNRQEHEIKLRQIFGINHFYDEQWDAISRILNGERILMIERTGFGKSLCYQYPATLFSGMTIVISPLISLMRDQVKKLNQKGISARFINSEQSRDENNQVLQDAIDGKVKILYVAPERLENDEWKRHYPKMNISFLVIDESHTICVWGHDFRPDFRKIKNLVKQLPKSLIVFGATTIAKTVGGNLS